MDLKRMRWAIHRAYMGQVRSAYKVLVGNCEGKAVL
jgi:hypothetical protein